MCVFVSKFFTLLLLWAFWFFYTKNSNEFLLKHWNMTAVICACVCVSVHTHVSVNKTKFVLLLFFWLDPKNKLAINSLGGIGDRPIARDRTIENVGVSIFILWSNTQENFLFFYWFFLFALLRSCKLLKAVYANDHITFFRKFYQEIRNQNTFENRRLCEPVLFCCKIIWQMTMNKLKLKTNETNILFTELNSNSAAVASASIFFSYKWFWSEFSVSIITLYVLIII